MRMSFEEEQIRKKVEQYDALLQAIAPNFVFVFDRNFIFQDIILPKGLRLFDRPEDLIGTNASCIYDEEVSKNFIQNINECLDTGELKHMEYYIDRGGTRLYYQAHIVPYEGDKGFALIQDISDRVRRVNDLIAAREQAEEADRMKTAFLANMSHEIRTPLNSIVGFSELIATGEASEDQREQFLQVIRTSNELLLKLINDVLDLSRIESGKSEIVQSNLSLLALLEEISLVYESKMKPGVTLKVVYPSEALWVKTDVNRVKQILYNYLSNAVKNTDEGTITLGIEKVDEHYHFFVTDTGRGIPSHRLEKIFDRFEKINEFAQGTGLGLSICYTLAQCLGGSVDVKSTLGKGSTFSLYLPCQKKEEKIGEEKQSERILRKRPLILIAEDTDDSYFYIEDAFKKEYDILRARDGKEAVSLFEKERPNLVIMNIQLPVMDGLESAQCMRKISLKIPIVGLTSNDFYFDLKKAMDNGYSDVVSKPYSATKLKEVVVALI